MTLITQINSLATAIATDVKIIYTRIGTLTSLTTTAKGDLVSAINEVKAQAAAAASSGGAQNLDQLTDVAIVTPATGQVLRYDGTNFVNVTGTTYFETAGAVAAAAGNYQPVDPDLTAIAALTTTAYGRALLAVANQAGLMGLLSASSTTVAGISRMATDAETLAGVLTGVATSPANVKAAIAQLLGTAPATLDTIQEIDAAIGNDPNFATTMTTALAGKQPLDADLTSIASLASAADKSLYATAAGTWALMDITPLARTFLAATTAALARSAIGAQDSASIGDTTTDFVAVYAAAKA